MIKSKNILITGASTGIGYDLAKVFVANGYRVFGSVRKQEDADRLSNELGQSFHALLFDVTDHKAVEKAGEEVTKMVGDEGLAGLINNAGIAVAGPFLDISADDYRNQFEVNLFGVIKVTQTFAPLLGAEKDHKAEPGRIVQISSVSGKFGMPFVSAYASSKHALNGFTDSIRKELLLFGISMVTIAPGPIQTPIWNKGVGEDKFVQFNDSFYAQSLEKYAREFIKPMITKGLTSEYLANRVLRIFESKNPKTLYTITAGKFFNYSIPRLLPAKALDNFVAKKLGFLKK